MTSLTCFPQFASLPIELQLQIWELAAEPSQSIRLTSTFLSRLSFIYWALEFTVTTDQHHSLYITLLRSGKMFHGVSSGGAYIKETISLLWSCRLSRKCVLETWKRQILNMSSEVCIFQANTHIVGDEEPWEVTKMGLIEELKKMIKGS